MFIFLPAATCYPHRGSPKTSYGLGWRGMSNLSCGLGLSQWITTLSRTYFFKSMQVFYQIKYLHTKLYFWCQAGSPIFFPFTSFFQPPLPTLPLLPTVIQTVFVRRRNWKVSPTFGGREGLSSVILCAVIYLSQWLQWQKCSYKPIVKGDIPWSHPSSSSEDICFGKEIFFSFSFKKFLVVVDMGWGLGRLLIQVLG